CLKTLSQNFVSKLCPPTLRPRTLSPCFVGCTSSPHYVPTLCRLRRHASNVKEPLFLHLSVRPRRRLAWPDQRRPRRPAGCRHASASNRRMRLPDTATRSAPSCLPPLRRPGNAEST